MNVFSTYSYQRHKEKVVWHFPARICVTNSKGVNYNQMRQRLDKKDTIFSKKKKLKQPYHPSESVSIYHCSLHFCYVLALASFSSP